MNLVIAEKPSVGMSIAKVLNAFDKHDGYVEGSNYIVSWCIGHLVTLADASAYGDKYRIWRKDDLPIIPDDWKYTVIPATKKQFDILEELMHRADVDDVVCATDAGREGELIFRLVYMMAKCNKPVLRLWLSSMEDSAIRKAFAELKPGKAYNNLYQAALCRQKADWIVGVSGTRLFSSVYYKTLPVGRVMTPTLALIADRDTSIESFRPEKFYTVQLDADFTLSSARISDKSEADKIAAQCDGKEISIKSSESAEKKSKPPKLLDLTSLQRLCNRLYGYTAKDVLDSAQELYEKKLLTYPRTDSCYVTDDTAETLPELIKHILSLLPVKLNGTFSNIRYITDNTKVTDHHALLPTIQVTKDKLSGLSSKETGVLNAVMFRLLAAVSEPNVYTERKIIASCSNSDFSAKGRTMISEGWKAIEGEFLNLYGKTGKDTESEDSEDQKLPDVKPGDILHQLSAPAVKEGVTVPPKHFTEDTLLSAMEHASAKEFAEIEDLERSGLGTPATRAGIIEKLIKMDFAERKGRQLLITEKGKNLIAVIPDRIKSPELTVGWERKLKDIELGKMDPSVFIEAIAFQMQSLVKTYKKLDLGETAFETREIIGKCPRCGSPVIAGKTGYFCKNKACSFKLWEDDLFFKSRRKTLTKTLAAAFLKNGKAIVRNLWSESKNKEYDAVVIMEDTGEKYVRFRLVFDDPVLKLGRKSTNVKSEADKKVKHTRNRER